MKGLAVGAMVVALSGAVFAKDPDCTGPDQWPAAMAQTLMTHAGLFDAKELDVTKTGVTRISSQKIGKDLYRQVHFVRFLKRNGEVIQAITVNDASSQKCSASTVDVYPVSQKIETCAGKSGAPSCQNPTP